MTGWRGAGWLGQGAGGSHPGGAVSVLTPPLSLWPPVATFSRPPVRHRLFFETVGARH